MCNKSMKKILAKLLVIPSIVIAMSGCTGLHRLAYMYSDNALDPNVHHYKDGGKSIYYEFHVGDKTNDTFIFFYGGSGCVSWKSVLPGYVDGLSTPAKVLALNKRHVGDRSTGMMGCNKKFHLYNNIEQWVSDYSDFILSQIGKGEHRPKNVVLVGVSEGVIPAVRVAGRFPFVTHLAVIGGGGFTMRASLKMLYRKGDILFDVDDGWRRIKEKPDSIDDTWYGNTYRWWSQILDYDYLPYFLDLNIPVLVGIGEQDESVPVESAYFLRDRFHAAGKKNLILKVYPMANHRLISKSVDYKKEFFNTLGSML